MSGRKQLDPDTMMPGLRHGEIAFEWAQARPSARRAVRARWPRLADLLDAHAEGTTYLWFTRDGGRS